MNRSNRGSAVKVLIAFLAVVLIVAIVGFSWGCPRYNVYMKEMSGKAQLAEAEQNRQIAIEEAKAKLESAKLLGDAEVERARGVAQANKIIGDSLAGNEAYLRYLWIQGLQDGTSEVIYIPTEANLPILEASRKMPQHAD